MNENTIRLFIYSLTLLALLFSCVYGARSLLKKGYGRYYFYIYLSILSMTLGRLFILVYYLAEGDTDGFSLASLGIVSAFFFIACANAELLEKIPLQISSGKVRTSRIITVLVMVPLLCVCAQKGLSIKEKLPSILLLVSAGYGFNSSLRIALAGKEGKNVYPHLVRFSEVVCGILVIAILTEASWLITSSSAGILSGLVLGMLNAFCFSVMLPVLERGIREWKM